MEDLIFGPGLENQSNDFYLKHNIKPWDDPCFDFLIFTDSRGVSMDDPSKSWSVQLFDYLNSKGVSVLLITRPRDCTVFLTLINFLRLNSIRYRYLVGHVGFVDFTPKKKELIDDILSQKNPFFGDIDFLCEKLPRYLLLNGEYANLFSVDFNQDRYKSEIVITLLKYFEYSILVGALEFPESVRLERQRPKEFYGQLRETNKFLLELSETDENIFFVGPAALQDGNNSSLSRDGVHFTEDGHSMLYNRLKKILHDTMKFDKDLR